MASDHASTDSERPSDWRLDVGETLEGEYRIVERIDSGAFAEVYAAERAGHEDRVALKLLRTDSDERDPRALARMRQEAEILRALDHPNLVDVGGFETSEYGEFLVMELLDGPTLEEVIEESGGEADGGRVQQVVEQILSALGAMHDEGVQHRDLKPENIVLTGPDDNPTVKLVDFGIAKAQDFLDRDHEEGFTLVETREHAFVGTPKYASPEQALGDPVGPSADLFSLGLVVLEWLTGESPFESNDKKTVVSRMIKPEPFDVSAAPEAWHDWLERMVAKQPEARFETAEEARQQLPAIVETDEMRRERAEAVQSDEAERRRESGETAGSPEEPTVVASPDDERDRDLAATRELDSAPDVFGGEPPPGSSEGSDGEDEPAPTRTATPPGGGEFEEGRSEGASRGERGESSGGDATGGVGLDDEEGPAVPQSAASTSTAVDRSAPRIEEPSAGGNWWLTVLTALLFLGSLGLFLATVFGWSL